VVNTEVGREGLQATTQNLPDGSDESGILLKGQSTSCRDFGFLVFRLCLLSALLQGLPAIGQIEFMLNGGFEAGSFTNWVLAADPTYAGVDNGTLFVPHSGSYEALLGNNAASGTLSQTVATAPGATYVLSYWFNNSYGDPGQFSVSWNGSVLLNETNPVDNGWTNY
jgi:hypothetical protein